MIADGDCDAFGRPPVRCGGCHGDQPQGGIRPLERLWRFGAGFAVGIARRYRAPLWRGASRMLLEEMPSRADAARLAGDGSPNASDAVVRYDAKGLEGLHDRPKGYSPRWLTADEEAAPAAVA